jgi:hypothetical protein
MIHTKRECKSPPRHCELELPETRGDRHDREHDPQNGMAPQNYSDEYPTTLQYTCERPRNEISVLGNDSQLNNDRPAFSDWTYGQKCTDNGLNRRETLWGDWDCEPVNAQHENAQGEGDTHTPKYIPNYECRLQCIRIVGNS